MDGDDPKSSLIALIVEIVSSRGPAERMLPPAQAEEEARLRIEAVEAAAASAAEEDAATAAAVARTLQEKEQLLHAVRERLAKEVYVGREQQQRLARQLEGDVPRSSAAISSA